MASSSEPERSAAPANDAFISYSRRDREFAEKLEKALERYRPPKDLDVPQRHLRVFRDEKDFTGVDYAKAVERHLQDTPCLIVLCSPQARQSPYVDDEIRKFAAVRGTDRIIPVLLSGLPNNEAKPGQEELKAFPEALCEVMEMPLAASYLGFDSRRDKVNKGEYFDPWSMILANLYGVSRGELEQREKRRRARTRRITVTLVSAIIAALSVALVVTLMSRREAVRQRGIAEEKQAEAETERDRAERAAEAEKLAREEEERQRLLAEERRQEAERQREIARAEAVAARRETANRLAVQALEKLAGTPEEALELAIAAVETYFEHGDPTVPRALEALHKTMFSFGGGRPVLPWRAGQEPPVLSEDLRWAAASDADGTVRFGPAGTADPAVLEPPAGILGPDQSWDDSPTRLFFSGGRLYALRQVQPRDTHGEAIWYWELGEEGVRGEARAVGSHATRPDSEIEDPLASPDGEWLSWFAWDGGDFIFLQSVDADSPTLVERVPVSSRRPLRAFSADSKLFVLAGDERLRRWTLDGPQKVTELPDLESGIWHPWSLAIAPEAGTVGVAAREEFATGALVRLALLDRNGKVEWWDFAASPPVRHELPDLFTAWADHLRVFDLDPGSFRARIRFHPAAFALMAELAESSGEFGAAAVHLFEGEGWRPLAHRNSSVTAVSRTLRASGTALAGPDGLTPGTLSGYDLKSAAQLGVAAGEWLGPAAMTVGLDGTLLFHDLESPRSDLVAVAATQAAMPQLGHLLVGHRFGKLSLIDLDDDPDDPRENFVFRLSAHDAPVARIVQTPDQARFASFSEAGDARIWSARHPSLLRDEFDRVSQDWRWMVVDGERDLDELWDLRAPDPFARPVTGVLYRDARLAALDLDGGWVATVHYEFGKEEDLVVRLWPLDGSSPPTRPSVERTFRVEGAGWWSHAALAVRGPEARFAIFPSLGAGVWVTDLRSERPLRELTEVAGDNALLKASPDLRWLLRRRQGAPGETKPPLELIALEDLESEPVARTIAGSSEVEWPRFSDDGGRLVLDGRAIELSSGREIAAAPADLPSRDPAGRYRVTRAPGRPDLDADGGTLWVLDPKGGEDPWRELVPDLDIRDATWDASGDWLAVADGAGRVWVLRPLRGAGIHRLGEEVRAALRGPSLPEPWDRRALQPIWSVETFSGAGWIVASTADEATREDAVLLWFRTPEGRWEEPLVFWGRDLQGPHGEIDADVRFRADGRQAILSGRFLSFEPDWLLPRARRLLSGRPAAERSAKPRAPER